MLFLKAKLSIFAWGLIFVDELPHVSIKNIHYCRKLLEETEILLLVMWSWWKFSKGIQSEIIRANPINSELIWKTFWISLGGNRLKINLTQSDSFEFNQIQRFDWIALSRIDFQAICIKQNLERFTNWFRMIGNGSYSFGINSFPKFLK